MCLTSIIKRESQKIIYEKERKRIKFMLNKRERKREREIYKIVLDII